MTAQEKIDFEKIANAIDFIKNNYLKQPSLNEIAANVHMSPTHFQKMFTAWAGISPKNFLQYISINYAKLKLRKEQATLFDTTQDIGLSATSRLHDLFIKIVAMTPAEYKNEGEDLKIEYTFDESNFGKIIIATTPKGICYLAFYENEKNAFELLKKNFAKANFKENKNGKTESILKILKNDFTSLQQIKLHVKGTAFQLKVWEALLSIPYGELTTYGDIATKAGNSKAARAVGTAIGDNPVAYLIPCHRVIQASGIFGGYMWGTKRKTAILGWEALQSETQ